MKVPVPGIIAALTALTACGAATGLWPDDAGDDDTSAKGRGSCATRCEVPGDCCGGEPDCPGPFPRNWECTGGFCALGGCAKDDDCHSVMNPELECHPAGGVGICFDPCENDLDCAPTPGATCRGPVDDGARLCGAFEFGCADDSECFGWGVCEVETGLCGCHDDADCATPGAGCRF